jgi:hypothetical protein
LNSTKIANISHFYGNYSEFLSEIAGGYFDDYDNKGLFLPIGEYYELLYEPFNEALDEVLQLEGHLLFSEYQQEIMYWSVDSISKCKAFENEFIDRAKIIYPAYEASSGPSSNFYNILEKSENNYALVALIFSLIQPVQIIIWLITFSLAIFIIVNEYKRSIHKELRQILSGKGWKERLPLVVLDTLFSTVPSIALSFGMLAVFVLTQRFLLGVPFVLATDIVSGLGIISAFFIVLVFVLRLDFEVYLRTLFTNKASSSSEYKSLSWLGNGYKVGIVFVLAIAVMFLYSKNALVFRYQLFYVFLSILVGFLVSLVLLGIYSLIRKCIIVRAKRKSSSLSAFQLLLTMWKQKLSRRTVLNAILFSFFCSTMIYTSIPPLI